MICLKKKNLFLEVYYIIFICFLFCKSNCFIYVMVISLGDLKMIYFVDFQKIIENRFIFCKKVKSLMIELIYINLEYLVIFVN